MVSQANPTVKRRPAGKIIQHMEVPPGTSQIALASGKYEGSAHELALTESIR